MKLYGNSSSVPYMNEILVQFHTIFLKKAMKLTLYRKYKLPTYTIGKLYVNDTYFCDVLEDTDRGLRQDMPIEQIKKIKIPNETAIPTGTYDINLTYSPKFAGRYWAKKYKNLVPLLVDVPGWSGVRIHPANTALEVQGCIAVGQNKVKGQVINSTITYINLMDKYIMPAYNKKEEIILEII